MIEEVHLIIIILFRRNFDRILFRIIICFFVLSEFFLQITNSDNTDNDNNRINNSIKKRRVKVTTEKVCVFIILYQLNMK